jgi:hypothetical protein
MQILPRQGRLRSRSRVPGRSSSRSRRLGQERQSNESSAPADRASKQRKCRARRRRLAASKCGRSWLRAQFRVRPRSRYHRSLNVPRSAQTVGHSRAVCQSRCEQNQGRTRASQRSSQLRPTLPPNRAPNVPKALWRMTSAPARKRIHRSPRSRARRQPRSSRREASRKQTSVSAQDCAITPPGDAPVRSSYACPRGQL